MGMSYIELYDDDADLFGHQICKRDKLIIKSITYFIIFIFLIIFYTLIFYIFIFKN